jgi:hypothetical protein
MDYLEDAEQRGGERGEQAKQQHEESQGTIRVQLSKANRLGGEKASSFPRILGLSQP